MVNPGLQFQYNQAAGCFMFWDAAASQWFYYNRQDDRLVYPDARVPRPVNIPASYYLDPRSPVQPVSSLPRDDYTAISPTLSPRYVAEDQRHRRVSSGDASHPNPRLSTSGTQRRGVQQTDQGNQPPGRSGQMSTDPTVPSTITVVNERTGTRTAVRAEPRDLEVLFPGYYMRRPSDNFFVVGRVFKTLWAEPVGGTTVARPNNNPSSGIVPARFRGEHIYTNIRRFVLVRAFRDSCHALPIVSFHKQGVGKDRVVKSEYAIIYTGKNPPDPMPSELPQPGERGLQPIPIRVVSDNPAVEQLDPSSRIQFSGIRTIQHNLKVKAVGMVPEPSIRAMLHQLEVVEKEADGRRRSKGDSGREMDRNDDRAPGPSDRGQMRPKDKAGKGPSSKGKERARDGHSAAPSYQPQTSTARASERLPPATAEQALWASDAVLQFLKKGHRMNQARTRVAHLVRESHPNMTMETAELQVSALLAQAKAIRKRQGKKQDSSEDSSSDAETD